MKAKSFSQGMGPEQRVGEAWPGGKESDGRVAPPAGGSLAIHTRKYGKDGNRELKVGRECSPRTVNRPNVWHCMLDGPPAQAVAS